MRFGVLGPLAIERDGESVASTGGRQRALLACLLAAGDETVATDALIDAVWGDDLPDNPANTLQHGIAQLRKILEPGRKRSDPPKVLVSEGSGYRLDLAGHDVDAREFAGLVEDARRLLADGSAELAVEAVEAVESALSLWRGPAYADFLYTDIALSERERLDELRVTARELSVDARVAAHGPEAVISDLEALVVEHPLREGLWARLMRGLYQVGRQADALRVYRRAAETLGEELGIEPSSDLRELEEQILLQDPSLARTDTVGHNLPATSTSIIGRAVALEQVLDFVRASSLVTLLGPGGSGKTRLAIEVARRSLQEHADGVWLVRLETLTDASLLAAHVAGVVRLPEVADSLVVDTLARFIGEKQMLLVLDNCEHMVEHVADLTERLLSSCPNLRVLATSQEALQLRGEQRFQVPPLGLPGADDGLPFEDIDATPAVALFMERAAEMDASIDGSQATLNAVANIVTALDGIPLAIELAAARTDVLTPSEIAQRLADRFSLLDSGARDAPHRQQTLRNAVAWAYDPLTDEEKAFFASVSVFSGGFDVVGAADVAQVSPENGLRLLGRLVQRSLLARIDPAAGRSRFRMLETLRQFGQNQLGEDLAAVRERHARFVADRVFDLDHALMGPDQVSALTGFLAEQENMRSAMAWSLESGVLEPGVRIGAWAGRYWDWRGSLAEAHTWLERLSAAVGDETDLRGLAFMESWCSYFNNELGDRERARSFLLRSRQAAEATGDWYGILGAMSGEAMTARLDGDPALAVEIAAEARRIAEDKEDRWFVAWADNHDSLALLALGRFDDAGAAAQRSREGFEAIGDRRATGWALTALAQVAHESGEYDRASDLAYEAVKLSQVATDGRNGAWAYEIAAAAARAAGEPDKAERYDAEAAALIEHRGMPYSPWKRTPR